MANKRIFYACQGVGITPHGWAVGQINADHMVHGLQSVGITTNFSLEQAFELGQIEIYENIEGTPDIEVTMEKVLDGDPLIYHMASSGINGGGATGLVARSKERCDIRLGIFSDEGNFIGGTSTAHANSEVYMSGMYISSISYNLSTDGSATESVTMVGNNKQWLDINNSLMQDAAVESFNGEDEPLGHGSATNPSGGISQKEDVMLSGCILPTSIEGTVGSGYGNAAGGGVHIQNVTVSTDFSREDIFELGAKTPYHRPANFPIEVTCDIEIISTSGDMVEATEAGDPALHGTIASGNNTSNESIFFYTRNGLGLDLGSKNRLSSISYGGGDAGGGNATSTYSFTNFNDLDVQMRRQGYIGFQFLKNGTGADGNGSVFGDTGL